MMAAALLESDLAATLGLVGAAHPNGYAHGLVYYDV
jgi:hypothetical protein